MTAGTQAPERPFDCGDGPSQPLGDLRYAKTRGFLQQHQHPLLGGRLLRPLDVTYWLIYWLNLVPESQLAPALMGTLRFAHRYLKRGQSRSDPAVTR
jgi:hypothetical protein